MCLCPRTSCRGLEGGDGEFRGGDTGWQVGHVRGPKEGSGVKSVSGDGPGLAASQKLTLETSQILALDRQQVGPPSGWEDGRLGCGHVVGGWREHSVGSVTL